MPKPFRKAKVKVVVLYNDKFQQVAVFPSRASADREKIYHSFRKEFHYVYFEQVKLLGYAQAVDLEQKLTYADNHKQQGE